MPKIKGVWGDSLPLRGISLLLLAGLLISLSLGPRLQAQDKTPIKIGLNVELTGLAADLGDLSKKAADLAVEEINAAGGINGRPIDLIAEDSQSSNQGAVAATNKLINSHKVVAMVGPVKSTQMQAVSDIIKKARLPTMFGGTNPKLTRLDNKVVNPWIFRCRPADSIAGVAVARFIVEDLKITKVGILHDSDTFGTTGAGIVRDTLKKLGTEPLLIEKYATGTENYQPQLLNMKAAGIEALVIYGTNANDDAKILRQIKELGLDFKVVGSPSNAQKITLDLAREAAEGIYAVVDYVPGQSEVAKRYREAYVKKYGSEPDTLAAWNYDALYILAEAMKKAGTDPEKIREAILATKGFKGVLGEFNFDEFGDGLHEVSMVQIKNGQPFLLRVIKENE
jgi:branched-chain amino acid transport system substrate-binding protein